MKTVFVVTEVHIDDATIEGVFGSFADARQAIKNASDYSYHYYVIGEYQIDHWGTPLRDWVFEQNKSDPTNWKKFKARKYLGPVHVRSEKDSER